VRRPRATARDLLEALLVAVVFALFARTFLVQAFRIPSGSMEPTLWVGDHLLVNKFVFAAARDPTPGGPLRRLLPARPPRRGDLVVFRYPEDPRRDFVKRCVALAGDTVEIRAKRLLVNGREVDDEGYTQRTDPTVHPPAAALEGGLRRRDHLGPLRVPAGHSFCLGDNRDESNDSRFWGPLPAGMVKGRALLVYWSTTPLSAAPGDAALGRPAPLRELRELPARLAGTRWDRFMRPVR
jgi:signal peptidase I